MCACARGGDLEATGCANVKNFAPQTRERRCIGQHADVAHNQDVAHLHVIQVQALQLANIFIFDFQFVQKNSIR